MEANRRGHSGLKVIFDTSFVIYICKKPSTVFREMEDLMGKIEPVLPSPVLKELKRLARRKKPAKLALEALKRMEVVEVEGPADRAIINLAKRLKVPVATLDRELTSILRKEGIPYFTVKDDHLITVGRPELR